MMNILIILIKKINIVFADTKNACKSLTIQESSTIRRHVPNQ